MHSAIPRRQILKTGLLAALGSSIIGNTAAAIAIGSVDGKDDSEATGYDFLLGIASYTFRKLSLADTIKALQRLNLHYISIKDFHLSLNSTIAEREVVVQQLKAAGITPLSCGNISMQNDEKDIRRAFDYAKDCGIPTIVCSPHPLSIPILDRMVKEYNIKLAIHNHGPEDKHYPSPYDVMKIIDGFDKRIGLCIDVGHTARAKVNPSEAIVKCKDRLYDLHFKDINTTAPDGATVEAGRGVLNLPGILRSLQKIKYPYLLSIEYEGWENDPLPAVAETVGYINALMAISKRKKNI